MFLVCSHLKKVRSIAYEYGTNKAQGCDKLSRPQGPSGPGCSLFVLLDHQAVFRKKYMATPTPKKSKGPSIYKAPQKILANFED